MPSRSLNDLHPALKDKARQLIELCKAEGIELRIISTYRSLEEQADLYAQGRSKPGKIVTYAKPGTSWHNWSLAFDCCPIYEGHPDWDSPHWDRIGTLGKKLGLTWGGDFVKLRDYGHFEWHPGLQLS
jgi:peptidoglycan L-alanyl-D-glutamate endopeptidase CwlK